MRARTSKYSAILLDWRFTEVKDHLEGARIQQVFDAFVQDDTPILVRQVNELHSRTILIFDPLWGQVWRRMDLGDLPDVPFPCRDLSKQIRLRTRK